MLTLSALQFASPVVMGQATRAGYAPDALPGVNEVPLALPQQPMFSTRFGLGYGYTESVFHRQDSHHRTVLDLAGAIAPAEWCAASLRVLGRYDTHSGGDDGLLGEMHLSGRTQHRVGASFAVGSQLSLWLPGGDTFGGSARALSGDLQLLGTYLPADSPLTLGLAVGLRVDRSKYAGGRPHDYSDFDRLSLGASDGVLAARLGLAASYRIGQLDVIAEWSWRMYFDYVSTSPMWLRAVVRYHLSRTTQLELLLGVSPSPRPPLSQGSALALVEPRFAAGLAMALVFPWLTESSALEPEPALSQPELNGFEGRASVEVHARAPNDKPIPGATVTLQQGSDAVHERTCDERGVCTFEELPPGSYRLRIVAKGFTVHEGVIELGEGDNAPIATPLKRELPSGQIRGTVRRFDGTPLRATIVIPALRLERSSGDDGSFEIDVPPGEYALTVKAPGFKDQTRKARVERRGVAILIMELESKTR